MLFLLLAFIITQSHALHMIPKLITVRYNFPHVPVSQGIKHIHTPEHICEVHKLGAPCFQLLKVDHPKLHTDSASILYRCSTLFVKEMRVLMYTTKPSESNLIFIKNKTALYNVRLRVVGNEESHTLKMDISFFNGQDLMFRLVTMLLPVFLAINGAEDARAFTHGITIQENQNLALYRSWVMRKHDYPLI
jgi:hypothetical protein